MGVILDTNWRVWADNADQVGWPHPADTSLASRLKRRTLARANSVPGWEAGMFAYQRVAADAREYAEAGFSVVGLPPSTKGAAGEFSGGYDMFDPYDIGSKKAPYVVPTAFGTREMLMQAVAAVHANGMQVYGDLVLHQYLGGSAEGVYQPLGSDGKTRNGRFPKHPSCFVGAPPRVPVDPVPDQTGNFAFGDMASYVNSTPKGYMHDGAIAAAAWLKNATGMDGWRIDDVKGTNAGVVWDLLHSPALAGDYAFGEYFDGENAKLWGWANGDMQGRASVLDFGFKFNMGNICNNNSRVWMGRMANLGFCNVDPFHAVTFLESADTDNSPGEQVIWNKMLGYAALLTFPGYPRVYYRDWSTDRNCYGLKDKINNLVWINNHLAGGDFVPRLDTDYQVFVFERTGYGRQPGCLTVLNNDEWNSYTRTVQTSFGPNRRVHEYTGNGSYDDLWTDGAGRLTFTVPRNNNGLSYLVYGLPEVEGATNPGPARQTTQQFAGAADLDLPPLLPGLNTIGRIFVGKGSTIQAELWPLMEASLRVLGPDMVPLGSLSDIPTAGWYTIQVTRPDAASPADYWLNVTYTGSTLLPA